MGAVGKGCGAAAANSDGGEWAGAITWLEPHSRVDRSLSRRVSGLGSSPDTDILYPDKQPPRRVPNDAQQRGVFLADQNHG